MKSKKLLWILILLGWLLTACQEEGRYQVTLITTGVHTLNGTTYGDLVMLGGETNLEEDAILGGSAHLLAGKFIIEGTISGDLSHLNGELSLGPTAIIEGDLNLVEGQQSNVDPGTVGGSISSGTGLDVSNIDRGPGWIALRWLISSLVLGLAAVVLERYLPSQVNVVGETALNHLPVVLAMGTLAGIVGLTLLVLMAYTIVLLPVAFLVLGLLGLSVIYSWIAWGRVLGRWAASKMALQIPPRWEAFFSTMIFFLILNGIGALPGLGGLINLLAAAAGLGAIYLTRFGSRQFIPASWQSSSK